MFRNKREGEGNSIRLVAKHTKIDHAVLSRIERGENRISFENAVVLCEYYGLSLLTLAASTSRKGNYSNGKS